MKLVDPQFVADCHVPPPECACVATRVRPRWQILSCHQAGPLIRSGGVSGSPPDWLSARVECKGVDSPPTIPSVLLLRSRCPARSWSELLVSTAISRKRNLLRRFTSSWSRIWIRTDRWNAGTTRKASAFDPELSGEIAFRKKVDHAFSKAERIRR